MITSQNCDNSHFDDVFNTTDMKLIFGGVVPELEKTEDSDVDIAALIDEYENKEGG